jgi:hypothetical protein
MDAATEQMVRDRAKQRCEYCLVPEQLSRLPFGLDHIVARQHRGSDSIENLALCCGFCNRHKGPNIAGIDPMSGRLCRLFNPRRDRWDRHFRLEGVELVGLTARGRTTIVVLAMNDPTQVAIREVLIAEESYPAWL